MRARARRAKWVRKAEAATAEKELALLGRTPAVRREETRGASVRNYFHNYPWHAARRDCAKSRLNSAGSLAPPRLTLSGIRLDERLKKQLTA